MSFRQKLVNLDGKPDSKGEFFAPYAIKNFGKTIPLRNAQGQQIGSVKLERAREDEEPAVYGEITLTDPSFSARPVNMSIGAIVYDCDHHFEKGVSVAIRANDADLMDVVLDGKPNQDERIGQVVIPKPVHDGSDTEPEE